MAAAVRARQALEPRRRLEIETDMNTPCDQ
jgi:hypothetical protein